jgi:hypothetical protein
MDTRISFRSGSLCKFLFGFAALAILVAARPARADDAPLRAEEPKRDDPSPSDGDNSSKTHIAVDFDFSSAFDALGTKIGGGGALRVGQKFKLLLVSLTPELGGSYHAFGGSDETRVYAGFLGARLGMGKIIEPSIFGHLGAGHGVGLQPRTGLVADGGLALDFTLLPLLDLGVHGAYNVVVPRGDASALKYFTLGAQAALVL